MAGGPQNRAVSAVLIIAKTPGCGSKIIALMILKRQYNLIKKSGSKIIPIPSLTVIYIYTGPEYHWRMLFLKRKIVKALIILDNKQVLFQIKIPWMILNTDLEMNVKDFAVYDIFGVHSIGHEIEFGYKVTII